MCQLSSSLAKINRNDWNRAGNSFNIYLSERKNNLDKNINKNKNTFLRPLQFSVSSQIWQ
jgi:hypothetical protein